MIYSTTVIKHLSSLLPFFGSATESTETDLEPPGPGDTPVQHGSFEGSFESNSSVASEDSNEQYYNALDEAETVQLSAEEATSYLKSVLKLETNPNTAVGDVRDETKPKNREQPSLDLPVLKGATQAETGRSLNYTQAYTVPEPKTKNPDWPPSHQVMDIQHQQPRRSTKVKAKMSRSSNDRTNQAMNTPTKRLLTTL
jgi:hypothetical protein